MANTQTKILLINDSIINESYKNIQRLREISSLEKGQVRDTYKMF